MIAIDRDVARPDAAEEVGLLARARAGDAVALGRLVEAHYGLAVSFAERTRAIRLDFDGRLAAALSGLVEAALSDAFDPAKGRFTTFAGWRMWGAIRADDWDALTALRLPYYCGSGGSPQAREMAAAVILGMRSLSRRDGNGAGPHARNRTLAERTPDRRSPDPAAEAERSERIEGVRAAMAKLDERDRVVLSRRFGLDGGRGATLEQVGEELGLTRQRVQQVEYRAMARLRRHLERGGLASCA